MTANEQVAQEYLEIAQLIATDLRRIAIALETINRGSRNAKQNLRA